MNQIARHPVIVKTLRTIGVDPAQYAVLLDLFSALGDRQEFEAGGTAHSLRVFVGIFAVFSGFINIIICLGPRPPVRSFVLGNFVFTTFLLMTMLSIEAINTFMNPVETSVLAHLPIRDKSYFAAKLTYLAKVVAYVVIPINVIPALGGLNLKDSSWIHPITYLPAVYLLGLFIALFLCGILGFAFRIIPAARIRNLILWIRIGLVAFMFAGSGVIRMFAPVSARFNIADSAAFPVNWFVALALPGSRVLQTVATLPGMLAMAVSAGFISFGIHSLSEGYLSRVHILLRSGVSRKYGRPGLIGPLIGILTGRPSGRAAFQFVYGMARTDWQFRRAVYPALFQLLLLPLIGMVRGIGRSPFLPGAITAAHFLPHVGLIGFLICPLLPFSDQHRAAWIFLMAPLESLRSFARGIYWALLFPVAVLPTVLLPLYVWKWGLADAALFTGYSIAVGSLYVSIELFNIDGLPFANLPQAVRGSLAAPLVIGIVLSAGIFVLLQWLFLFQSRLVAAGATVAFAGLAYIVARYSLRYL